MYDTSNRQVTDVSVFYWFLLLLKIIANAIVLLILAGVTIATLTGENGVLSKANTASIETRASSVEEMKNLWKSNKKADDKAGETTAETLEELLNDLENQKLITADERKEIEQTGKVTIGSKTIVFTEYVTVA